MGLALATVFFVAVFTVAIAGAAWGAHRALRPTEMNARSATALRELEPRGGRQRFHARLFEVLILACAFLAGTGAFLIAAAAHLQAVPPAPAAGGAALLVALWWSWRRGALRTSTAQRPPREPEDNA